MCGIHTNSYLLKSGPHYLCNSRYVNSWLYKMEGCECACKKIVCVDRTSMCMLSKKWFVHLLSNHTWSALCGTHTNSYHINKLPPFFLYLLRLKGTPWLLCMLQFHHRDTCKYTINVHTRYDNLWVYYMQSLKVIKC